MTEPEAPQTPSAPSGGGSTGIDPKLAGLLCYLFAPLAGIIFYLMEKEDKFIRFHALQSIALAVAGIVISIGLTIIIAVLSAVSGGLGCILSLIWPIFGILWIVVVILAMVKAYQGEMYKLPVLGDMVEKYV